MEKRFWIAFEGTDNEQIYDSLLHTVIHTKYDRRLEECKIDVTDETWKPIQ